MFMTWAVSRYLQKNMHNALMLCRLNFDSLLNGNVSVGDNRLFKVNVSDQECTVIQSVNELISAS